MKAVRETTFLHMPKILTISFQRTDFDKTYNYSKKNFCKVFFYPELTVKQHKKHENKILNSLNRKLEQIA